MFERELRRFRHAVRTEQYDLRLHALEELEADGFSVRDLESCVLTGLIVERQRDFRTGEWKYVIAGSALDGSSVTLVAKWIATGRMIVLTVFRT